MFARLTRVVIRGAPVSAERVEAARGLMKSVSRMAGHRGAIWLLDPETGAGTSIDFYEERQDLGNTSQGDLRDELLGLMDADLIGIEEYEVAALDRVFGQPTPP